MELARVLDQDHPIAASRDLGEERVDERRLARARPADNDDVPARLDSFSQRLRLQRRHDPRFHIIGEAIEHAGGLADGEARRRHHRRQEPFEALAALGQFGRDDRAFAMAFLANMARHQPDNPLGLGGADPCPRVDAPVAMAIDPQPAVGIDHHFDDGGVGQRRRNRRSHGGAQHGALAIDRTGMKAVSHGLRLRLACFRPEKRPL
ncbi:hypothetical protein JCM17846_33110 [Iodidimonas nitroreducens]|uniref:Uncharacterized protein n=1 Tax=Iodidimonas nitroreducens TaxID=1236968 RepID=A0A5A7NEX6_9PROT|nr:hypothetical protein JCM17846_33110 [Iodidimonas nitroreducens]